MEILSSDYLEFDTIKRKAIQIIGELNNSLKVQ